MRFFLSCILLLAGSWAANAQPNAPGADSLQAQLRLLRELTQADNFEKAAVEASRLRAFLDSRSIFCPAAAVPLVSGIYRRNKDEDSALLFLEEAEIDARRDRNPQTKADLLAAVAVEFEQWKAPERALICYKLLNGTKDTLTARQLRTAQARSRQKIDSIDNLRLQQGQGSHNMVSVERDRALALAAILGLVFIALLVMNARTNDRWRRKMDNRELEFDIQINSIRQPDPPVAQAYQPEIISPGPVEKSMVAAPALPKPTETPTPRPFFLPNGELPQLALLIEPNRQIVLYLKSLLADRFQIETAQTPTEGVQMANNLLPDLIICDAVLNGRTGIDVARQLKLSERTNHIPVVLLTEKFGPDGKLDALRAGADSWFTRPVLDDEFDAQVMRLINSQKARHQQFARFLQLYYTDNRLSLDNQFLNGIVTHIETRLGDPDFMADDLARKAQLPNSLFTKKLRVLSGKEPVQLIREMRLEKAKSLLEKRAAPPQVIAELVGFTNPGTFALAFKEYFGENTLLLQMPPKKLN